MIFPQDIGVPGFVFDAAATKERVAVAELTGEIEERAPTTSLTGVRGRLLAGRIQLSEEIGAYIRELILSGHLRSEQSLNIEGLARELETSATPVREALLGLRGEGFVQMEPRRGFRVAPLSQQDIEDMFLVQSVIAGELAGRAAKSGTEPFLNEINRLQERMQQADVRSYDEEMEQLNYEFHRAINRTASSRKLTWLLGVVMRYVPRLFYAAISGWHEASLRDHAAIIEAIRDRDPEAARLAMAAHIQHAGALLVAHLESQGFWTTPDEESRS